MTGRRTSAQELSGRPGFLLRKAHQVAVAIFAEEAGDLGLTPPQHNVLSAISSNVGLHQAGLSAIVGYDRATVGALLMGLEARKLIKRGHSSKDGRVRTLELTARGVSLLAAAASAMARINERIVAPLAPPDRKLFIALLTKIAFPAPGDAQ
jgi:MarR family transcriptional regulator, lower aerobic nicotinate degradation pathway regulator